MLSIARKESLRSDRETKEAQARLITRLAACGLKYRLRVPGDGNCLFAAVSDQLLKHDKNFSHEQLRARTVRWLRLSPDYVLPNGASMSDFLGDDDDSWDKYAIQLRNLVPGVIIFA